MKSQIFNRKLSKDKFSNHWKPDSMPDCPQETNNSRKQTY